MDNDGFKKEVVELLLEQEFGETGRLSRKEMDEMDASVHAHIDAMFDVGENRTTASGEKRVGRFFEFMTEGLLAEGLLAKISLAMVSLAAVGAITIYLIMNDNSSDLPKSLGMADLEQYIVPMAGRSKGFSVKILSDQRKAFLVGITQADIDVSQKTEFDISIANSFQKYSTGTSDSDNAMQWLEELVSKIGDDRSLQGFMIGGYAAEIVGLSALDAAEDLDTAALGNALSFYRSETMGLYDSHDDVSGVFVEAHNYLMRLNIDEVGTPDEIQAIIDTIRTLKVAIE